MMLWRGITSSGLQTADEWKHLHRHRLVLFTNGTRLALEEEPPYQKIMTTSSVSGVEYKEDTKFMPAEFAKKRLDVGFPKMEWCIPNCDFLKKEMSTVKSTSMAGQFKYQYLIDVDGHSFSGRWHAFLKSYSLGLKATIFREWHDSRLFAWHHFVPVDNRYDDLYSLLTYFMGLGLQEDADTEQYVPMHDREAQILAYQGMEWGRRVLRREDMEAYSFRLMLEYARILDDERDSIGYSGDGTEMDETQWFTEKDYIV